MNAVPAPLLFAFKLLVSMGCGLLLAWPYRTLNCSGPVWLALAPVFYIVAAESRGRAALLSFVFALSWTLPAFSFIWHLTAAGAVALAVYSSLIYMVGLLAVRSVARRAPVAAVLGTGCIWVLIELLRANVPILALPWLLLGHSLLWNAPLRQGADLLGGCGLSFLLATFNALLAFGLPSLLCRTSPRESRLSAWRALCLVLALLAGAYAYGVTRIAEIRPLLMEGPAIGLVQGNIVEKLDRTEEQLEAQLVRHMELHREVVKRAAERGEKLALVCWAETMVPGCLNDDDSGVRFKRCVTESGIPALAGSNFRYPGAEGKPFEDQRFSNAAYIIDANGVEVVRYLKRRLVPFGEYVPGLRTFSFMQWFGSVTRDRYLAGTGPSPIWPLEQHRVALNICVEDIHPALAREAAQAGADTLLNVTNDGWFYGTFGPRAHFQAAAWRSIEVRRPMLRVTNTGWTAAIDPLGDYDLAIPPETEGTGVIKLKYIPSDGHAGVRTLYCVLGDLGVALLFAGALGLVLKLSRNRVT